MHRKTNSTLRMHLLDPITVGERFTHAPRIVHHASEVAPGAFRRFAPEPQLAIGAFLLLPYFERLIPAQQACAVMFAGERHPIQASCAANGVGLLRSPRHLVIAMKEMHMRVSRAPASTVKVQHWLQLHL